MPVIGLVKLLVTAAAIVGAVQGLRALIERGRAARPQPGTDAVEMTECETCGIYVTGACERPDCPLA